MPVRQTKVFRADSYYNSILFILVKKKRFLVIWANSEYLKRLMIFGTLEKVIFMKMG